MPSTLPNRSVGSRKLTWRRVCRRFLMAIDPQVQADRQL
jgi:hypothetical protein